MIFRSVLTDSKINLSIEEILPFVSEKTFTSFVDEYILGKYQEVDLDAFYPFMNSQDMKRILEYYLIKDSMA